MVLLYKSSDIEAHEAASADCVEWSKLEQARLAANRPVRTAEIVEFPKPAVEPEYRQGDLGTAEEFYIAEQPFAPQWDWSLRKL